MAPAARPQPLDDELIDLIAAQAPADGPRDSLHPDVRFYRASQRLHIRKSLTFGPTLKVVAQGRKLAHFGDLELHYEPRRYLVVTGEALFDAQVLETTPERPYLAVCLDLPPELIAKTLLTLADTDPTMSSEAPPAFVAPLDAALQSGVVRLLRAIGDPLERRVVAPLIIEELVFRLLRSDAATLLRRSVVRDADAIRIEEAMRFMRAHVSEPLSVAALALRVAMSPSHFAHRFRALARVSPMRYIKQLRLSRARELLLADGLRVNEVAARVGYESTSHFTRDFRARFGAAPAAYARHFR